MPVLIYGESTLLQFTDGVTTTAPGKYFIFLINDPRESGRTDMTDPRSCTDQEKLQISFPICLSR